MSNEQTKPEGIVTAQGQGIATRYAGPTNTRGARIIATWTDGPPPAGVKARVSMPYRHDLNTDEAHQLAAELLRASFEVWRAKLYGEPVRQSSGFRWTRTSTERGYIWTLTP